MKKTLLIAALPALVVLVLAGPSSGAASLGFPDDVSVATLVWSWIE